LPTWHRAKLGAVRLVRNKRKGTLLYVQRGGNQSAVDENGVSLDSYIHALYGLTLQAKPHHVLMIGCAGGTLATMLSRAGVRMTVVDIDKASFTLAKKYFGLPKSVTCRVADGLDFLQKTKAAFDAIIVDAFIGEKIPPQFTGDSFSAAVRRRLKAKGVLFMNVCLDGRGDRTAVNLGRGLKRTGWGVRLIDQRGPQRNAIVIAGKRPADLRKFIGPKLLARPALDAKRIAAELKAMRFKPLK
jgi:spermidine synthase